MTSGEDSRQDSHRRRGESRSDIRTVWHDTQARFNTCIKFKHKRLLRSKFRHVFDFCPSIFRATEIQLELAKRMQAKITMPEPVKDHSDVGHYSLLHPFNDNGTTAQARLVVVSVAIPSQCHSMPIPPILRAGLGYSMPHRDHVADRPQEPSLPQYSRASGCN